LRCALHLQPEHARAQAALQRVGHAGTREQGGRACVRETIKYERINKIRD
jgi:hypothetical protein